MGRRKHQSKAISDAIDPKMGLMEKMWISALGDLKDSAPLLNLLREFYKYTHVEDDILSGRMHVSALLLRELEAGNSEFFEALSKMIPIAKDIKQGPSPIERALLFFQGTREGTFAGMCSGTWNESGSETAHEQIKQLFPVWPATIKELHSVISGKIKCDEKTIRDAVKRLGYPVRAGKMGAPKKEK